MANNKHWRLNDVPNNYANNERELGTFSVRSD